MHRNVCFNFLNAFILCVCVHVHASAYVHVGVHVRVVSGCKCATTNTWRSENNSQGSVFFFLSSG